MYDIGQCRNIIEKALKQELKLLESGPAELYQPVEYIFSIGGKRIRPVLVLLACNLFSGDIEKAIRPALGIEFFHNFTLLHDDIMDNSPMRRNSPTVHKKWNENTAILSGDAMAIIAFRFIAMCPASVLIPVLELFTNTALKVCEGQQLDMNFETRQDVSEAEYIEMIGLKTAMLIAASLKTGALIGGAGKEDSGYLYDFGKNIGLAFQLQDDYLDVFGNVESFGKSIGNDIVTNKKTYLLIRALEIAKDHELEELKLTLDSIYTNPEDKIKKVTGIYNKLNIREHAAAKMTFYHNLAFQYLDKVKVADKNKEYLRKVTDKLINRER
jgi:geranylgeranyl diphosphate synthase type II